ncbi:hypothetical protein F9C06_18425 [Klebsiella quasipneumoniae]|nr:hypothetical protein F9C06_18425 [Klebsiella quasipneumoniae]
MILPVAKVAGSVLHVSRFYSTPLLTATISDQNHKTEIIFFLFLVQSNETHHDFVEPVSYKAWYRPAMRRGNRSVPY